MPALIQKSGLISTDYDILSHLYQQSKGSVSKVKARAQYRRTLDSQKAVKRTQLNSISAFLAAKQIAS